MILGSLRSFKIATYFVCIPLWLISTVNCYIKEQEQHHDKPPEFIPYPYMRINTKVRFKIRNQHVYNII